MRTCDLRTGAVGNGPRTGSRISGGRGQRAVRRFGDLGCAASCRAAAQLVNLGRAAGDGATRRLANLGCATPHIDVGWFPGDAAGDWGGTADFVMGPAAGDIFHLGRAGDAGSHLRRTAAERRDSGAGH